MYMLGSTCSPCCGPGVPACNDPVALPNKPVTDPATEGEWVPSGTWNLNAPSSSNTMNGITWTFVPNVSGTGGSTWFFFGSAETSSATGTATAAEQADWDNPCNWYSSSNAAPFYYAANSPNMKLRLDKRASTLPSVDATIHFYTTPNLATTGPKTCAVAYFHRGEIEAGGTLTCTGTAIDSPGGAVFMTSGTSYGAIGLYGGVKGTYNGGSRFHQSARLYGTCNGTTNFSGQSGMFDGAVNGDVTMTQFVTNGAITFGNRPAVNGNFTGNAPSGGHAYLDITGTATVTGGAFTGMVCDSTVAVSGGTFSGYCGSTVTASGTGVFVGGCLGAATATGSASLRAGFNTGSPYTIPTATLYDTASSYTNPTGSFGTVTCYNSSTFFGTVTTKASMHDTSHIPSHVTGDVDFYDSSYIGGTASDAVLTGTAVFNNTATLGKASPARYARVVGTATFNDSSECAFQGWINGNATFNDTTVCRGFAGVSSQGFAFNTQTGVATFSGSACCTLLYTSSTANSCPSSSYFVRYWTPTPFVSTGLACNGTAPAWYCNTTDTCGCG